MSKHPTTRPGKPSRDYTSRFNRWDQQSWVRTKDHHVQPFEPGLEFFSEAVPALFRHPMVRNADRAIRSKLLVLYLYNYLEFTVWLELGPVNEVCELLRRPDFLPWLPPQMKADALKIYVDEGGHAEMSAALRAAVEDATDVRSIKRRPAFLATLDRLVKREEPEFEPFIKLFFAIISETLITGTLTKLPKDEQIQIAVRELAADHASDEGRHHAYFRSVFEFVWPRLPRETRRKVGVILPEMILTFLEPDPGELTQMLDVFPEIFPLPGKIANEIVHDPGTRTGVAESAWPTIKMLSENGVFDEQEIANAFQARGLLLFAPPDQEQGRYELMG